MGSPIGCIQCGRPSLEQLPTADTNKDNMDSRMIFPTATIFLVLCLIDTGSSIQCHQCNSYDQVHCNDPFYYDDTPVNPDGTRQPKTDAFLKDCPADGKTYFCRKIYQNVRGDTRVIRGCGYETEGDKKTDSNCYTTVLEEYNTEVCACNTDGCNSASMYKISAAVVSAVALAYLLH